MLPRVSLQPRPPPPPPAQCVFPIMGVGVDAWGYVGVRMCFWDLCPSTQLWFSGYFPSLVTRRLGLAICFLKARVGTAKSQEL